MLIRRTNRRRFLAGMGALAARVSLPGRPTRVLASARVSTDYPFALGVASGDPLPDAVVLWTRLAPDPLNGGGMAPEPIEIPWEVAHDERFERIVNEGTVTAT